MWIAGIGFIVICVIAATLYSIAFNKDEDVCTHCAFYYECRANGEQKCRK